MSRSRVPGVESDALMSGNLYCSEGGESSNMTRVRDRRSTRPPMPESAVITDSGRLRLSGFVVHVAVWLFIPPVAWAFAFGLVRYEGSPLVESVYTALVAASAAIFLRSFWVGVTVDQQRVVVRRWFGTTVIGVDRVHGIVMKPYVGFLTGWVLTATFFNSRFMMLGWEDESGRRRYFPSTVVTNRRSRAQAGAIARRLGVDVTTSAFYE